MSPSHFSRTAGVLVCGASSLVLIFAAVMKWEQLPVLDRTGGGSLNRPGYVIAQIIFETALAGWLLFGVWPRWTRWIPAACFGLLTMVALYFAISGAESCGCFGRVKVNPWVTFGMDVVLATALFVWPPGAGKQSEDQGSRVENGQRRKTTGLAYRVVVVSSMVAIALVMGVRRLPQASVVPDAGGMVQAGSLTILEPEKWVGKTLPILLHLDVGERLKTGQWLAVLYHADCSTCREAVPVYERMASASRLVAFLETPPYAAGEEQLVAPGSKALTGRLSDAREWFATMPVVMLLDDGVVREVMVGNEALKRNVDWKMFRFVVSSQK